MKAARHSEIIGLRSDLLGPDLPKGFLDLPDDRIGCELCSLYPIREVEKRAMTPEKARRLAETRLAIESFPTRPDTIFTNAWMHVDLAEAGFISAVLNGAGSVAIVTSSVRKNVVGQLASKMGQRLRYFECPAYPWEDRESGGNHAHIWRRWQDLLAYIEPSRPGQPLLISAGIWTKAVATVFRDRGGVAIDLGSVMDYLDGAATRPPVLATYYGNPKLVPNHLKLEGILSREKRLEDFC